MKQDDQLRQLFRMQKELNAKIGVRTENLDEATQVEWILNYCRAITQEIAELTDSVPWKWWANYQRFDKQNARVEIIDLFHFVISLAQVVGMEADEVFEAYCKKHAINLQRQDSGYAKKDDSDSKKI